MILNITIGVIGSSSVGKSCFANRFVSGKFSIAPATDLVNYLAKEFQVGEEMVRVSFIDTAGTERRSDSLIPAMFRRVDAFIIMYSIDNKDSYTDVKVWEQLIERLNLGEIPIMLIGNKDDLESERKINSYDASNQSKLKKWEFMETSALKNRNVDEAITMLCKKVLKNSKFQKKQKPNSVDTSFESGKDKCC